jgi:GTP:adenosylcobinamide-phosphate guanylyltransferase
VIFFTDGQDGDRNQTDTAIDQLSHQLNQREIVNRYLTLGFSRDHDAVFLNKIA